MNLGKSRLATIFAIVFVDLVGFGLILPLLPFYAQKYGASALMVGLLASVYALAQMIGAPVLGRMSDRYGRRPILMVSIFGTFIGFLLLGLAEPIGKMIAGNTHLQDEVVIGILFLSRVIDGLTGGNITVAQAYITDVTDEKNRAKGLGLIGAAFGMGFILGPAIGGLLSRWGYPVPAFAAALLSMINLVMVFFLLPESLTAARRAAMANRPRPAFSARALWEALNRPRVGPLIHIRFIFGLASAAFQGVFALYAAARLGLDAQGTGLVLAYVGVLVVLVQGVAIGRLTARFSESLLILWASALMAVSLAAWALVPSLPLLLIVLIPLSLGTGVLNTVINSALTKSVYPEEIGGTLGLAASAESLSRVIGPSLAALLLGSLGAWAPGIFGGLLMIWVTSFAYRRLITRPDPPLPSRGEPAAYGEAGA